MKCGNNHRALTGHDALTAMHDERSHLRAHPPDAWSPDEDHLDGPATFAKIRLPFRLEALLLPAVCVPLGRDIDEAERRLPRAFHVAGQEYKAGARAHDGLARRVELLERRHEIPFVEELEQGRALPAGHDEPAELVELPGQPDLDRLDAEPVEGLPVQVEVALEGEHAYGHGALLTPPLPTARLEQVGLLELRRLDPGHGVAQILGDLGQDVGVLE